MLKGEEKEMWRNIKISYEEITVDCKVEATAIVSEYFSRNLFIKLNDQFNAKAKQLGSSQFK